MASVFQSVGAAVGWRNHQVLEDFDENDSPKPDNLRKASSAGAFNSMRMSLRKRLPLKPVKTNISDNPTWESLQIKKSSTVQNLTRSAKGAFGSVSQKIQKTYQSPSNRLVTTPGKQRRSRVSASASKRTPPTQTPKRQADRRTTKTTPVSGVRRAPSFKTRCSPRVKPTSARTPKWRSYSLIDKDATLLRRSVRTAVLKSPYASPATINRRRQFDRDLETVSTGIRQLKHLSQVFDDVIVREESEMTVCLI
ncbi:protein PIMREG [Latimeria chalumnae]|uniref:protein PIMREG n=1 Tax=Latimeria chalumnae TaxID=7897 RepID=UPI0003C1060B|nr:PREDICTED: protein FAM64A isoform X2 [Latimeria chalumnae]|eukprot:XP_005987556.1 PREDICTED: protein FAM64A isoform X2 [Latimeria chalumnae]